MGNFHEAKVEKVSYRGGRFGCPRLYLVLYRKYDDTRGRHRPAGDLFDPTDGFAEGDGEPGGHQMFAGRWNQLPCYPSLPPLGNGTIGWFRFRTRETGNVHRYLSPVPTRSLLTIGRTIPRWIWASGFRSSTNPWRMCWRSRFPMRLRHKRMFPSNPSRTWKIESNPVARRRALKSTMSL